MMAVLDGRAEFCHRINVSRETMAKLNAYVALVEKWSAKINLVSKASLVEIWIRHMLDSAQIYQVARLNTGHWLDIGAGGGFPGAVIAIMASTAAPEILFTFVDSDARKTVFLQTVVRELSLNARVIPARIEDLQPLAVDILSARAVAPLKRLLGYAQTHLSPAGKALFMKGASYRKELDEALEFWTFQSDEYPSITHDAAVILSLGDIKRV